MRRRCRAAGRWDIAVCVGGGGARAQGDATVEMRVKGVSVGSVAIPERTSGRGSECAHLRPVNQRGMSVGVGIQVCV